MLEVMRGKKPDRPSSGFSDALWNLLLAAWDAEHRSQPSKRPFIQSVTNQLQEDVNEWDQLNDLPTPGGGDESCKPSAYFWMQGRPLRRYPLQQGYWGTPNGREMMVSA